MDGHRVEEDDLDVEEDEEHRDQVEADPEPEAPLHVRRQAAFIGRGLGLTRLAGAEEAVERRERDPDRRAEPEEDKHRKVATQQQGAYWTLDTGVKWPVLYTTLVTMCYIVLSVAMSAFLERASDG